MSSTDEWRSGISDVGTSELDAIVDAELTNTREQLEKADYDTVRGSAMNEDAQRVSCGELSGDEAATEVVRGDA